MKVGQIDIAEAMASLAELIARAEAGEEIVIASDGKPMVVLKPAKSEALGKPERREIGFLSHLGDVVAPDTWEPDEEAADFAAQSFEEDFVPPRRGKHE